MHDKPTQLLNLSDRVAALAEGTVVAGAHAVELGEPPPAGLWMTERELWRWAWQLRRCAHQLHPATSQLKGTAPQPRRVAAVLLLVEVDDPALEDELLANAIMRGVRDHGTILLSHTTPTARPARRVGWRLRHVTAYPNLPTALAALEGREAEHGISHQPEPDPGTPAAE